MIYFLQKPRTGIKRQTVRHKERFDKRRSWSAESKFPMLLLTLVSVFSHTQQTQAKGSFMLCFSDINRSVNHKVISTNTLQHDLQIGMNDYYYIQHRARSHTYLHIFFAAISQTFSSCLITPQLLCFSCLSLYLSELTSHICLQSFIII